MRCELCARQLLSKPAPLGTFRARCRWGRSSICEGYHAGVVSVQQHSPLFQRLFPQIAREGNPMIVRTMMLRHLVFAASLSAATAWAQPDSAVPAPVPSAIQSAKTIFVSNGGSDSGLFPAPFSGDPTRTYNDFYADLKATGQFQLVSDPAEADLVLEIGLTAPYGPTNPNKQNGAADPRPMFRLVVYERKTHFVLWTLTQSVGLRLFAKDPRSQLRRGARQLGFGVSCCRRKARTLRPLRSETFADYFADPASVNFEVIIHMYASGRRMKLSAAGLELLKKSEGFRDRTYLDVAGLPTIGYGHRLVHPECYPAESPRPRRR